MKRFLLLLLTLVFANCGGGSDTVLSDQDVTTTTLTVGVIAPLDAGLTSFGRGIRNSVQLAVDQANRNQAIPGVTLLVDARDDSSDPDVGAAAASQLALNPTLVGVIGTYNSGVAFRTAPILQGQGIVQISPANTDPTLTQPTRQFTNYFRVVVPDSVQGPFLADRAFDRGYRRVAVVTESKSVSQGLADAFSQRFTERGGTILITEVVPEGTTDYSAILTRVRGINPELLFYGGEYQTADLVRVQSSQLGLRVPLMGGDGVKDDAYIAGAQGFAEGDLASTVGAPIAKLPGGPQFQADYEAAGFSDPPTDFGPFAFDATNALIDAVRRAMSSGATREVILANVQTTSLAGVTGPVAFTANGDPQNQLLTLYQVQEGVWVPLP